MVYLIHFDRPLAHANHYIGYTSLKLKDRLDRHRKGAGARLLRALKIVGIGWSVARKWNDGNQEFERLLKNRKHADRICPKCQPSKKLCKITRRAA